MRSGILAVVAILAGASISRGAVLVDNLSLPAVPPSSSLGNASWLGQAFQTDTQSWQLDDIAILGGSGVDTDGFVAELRTGTASSIDLTSGGLVASFPIPAGLSTPGDSNEIAFFPSSSTTLTPSTRYWFLLTTSAGAPGTAAANWSYTADVAGTSGPGTIPATGTYIFSSDQGSSWSPGDLYPQFIKVDATAVPEPSVAAIFGLVGAAGFLRRPSSAAREE